MPMTVQEVIFFSVFARNLSHVEFCDLKEKVYCTCEVTNSETNFEHMAVNLVF